MEEIQDVRVSESDVSDISRWGSEPSHFEMVIVLDFSESQGAVDSEEIMV